MKGRLQIAGRVLSTGSFGPAALAVGLCVATAVLVWFGYRATQQSNASTELLLERRVREHLALLWTGVSQDMKGAHTTVLVPLTLAPYVLEPPYEFAETFARAFARFPYPESFFVWRDSDDGEGLTYVFNRANRVPPWYSGKPSDDPYPVVAVRNPIEARAFVDRARAQAGYGQPSAVFDLQVAGVPYQVVTSFQYHTEAPERPLGLVGFTVNLQWVREHYFEELADQINRIGSLPTDVSLEILDGDGRTITATRPRNLRFRAAERSFPLVFADRALLRQSPRDEMPPRLWMARATAANDSPLAASVVGTSQVFLMTSLSAVAVVVGLLLTLRGVHVAAGLARMKSDFVSGVTHDLKTPLTVIRLLADTLARGRYDSSKSARDYATQLSRESRNLSMLIDHLLAYARLADGRQAYTFDRVEVAELIDDVMGHFDTLLVERGFDVTVDVAHDLPAVWGDRSALIQVVDNLIDNAIKYSGETRTLHVHASDRAGYVTIAVTDRGVGIPPDELERVFEKFSRGRNARPGGSGLGLAIARQIVSDHKGRLAVRSAPERGTTVEATLPAVAAA